MLDAAVEALTAEFDQRFAGFGRAPKFPPSMLLEFLLRAYARAGDPRALDMVDRTCEAMARGGMYDQLAGGFARYSVDAAWVVPHFEKMLYDNALLLRPYLHWWRATGDPAGGAGGARDGRLPAARPAHRRRAGSPARSMPMPPASRAPPTSGPRQELTEVLGEADGGVGRPSCASSPPPAPSSRARRPCSWPADPDDLERWEAVRATLLAVAGAASAAGPRRQGRGRMERLAIAALAEAGALLQEPAWVAAAEARRPRCCATCT